MTKNRRNSDCKKLSKISRYMAFKYKLISWLPFASDRGAERRAGRNSHVGLLGQDHILQLRPSRDGPQRAKPNAPGTHERRARVPETRLGRAGGHKARLGPL